MYVSYITTNVDPPSTDTVTSSAAVNTNPNPIISTGHHNFFTCDGHFLCHEYHDSLFSRINFATAQALVATATVTITSTVPATV